MSYVSPQRKLNFNVAMNEKSPVGSNNTSTNPHHQQTQNDMVDLIISKSEKSLLELSKDNELEALRFINQQNNEEIQKLTRQLEEALKQVQAGKTQVKEKELLIENSTRQIEKLNEKLKDKEGEIIALDVELKSLRDQSQDLNVWKGKVNEMVESKKKLLEKAEENTANLVESIKQAQMEQLVSRDKRIEELEELVWLNNVKFAELTNELSQVKGTLGGLRESSMYSNNSRERFPSSSLGMNNNNSSFTPSSVSSLHSKSFKHNNHHNFSGGTNSFYSSPSSLRKKKETVDTIKNLLDW